VSTATLFDEASSWADLSPCGTYRYLLGRRVGDGHRTMLFVMLNPSTADAQTDDPTIRRCIGFARRERCGVLEVINLFAFRTTDPAALLAAEAPVGRANDHFTEEAVKRAAFLVVAWGAVHRRLAWRVRDVRAALWYALPSDGRRGPFCLGTTATGAPRHPLYVKSDQTLELWEP
jgi:hypothetical protein